MLSQSKLGPYRSMEHGCSTEELSAQGLEERISELAGYELLPVYERSTLEWLLGAAASKRGQGSFQRRLVRCRESKQVLGWYIYYLNPRATSEVLQIGATSRSFGRVFGCLVEEASRRGANALSGHLDPRFMHELSQQHCSFHSHTWLLVHAKNSQLVDRFHRGEAFFTGLEGEQWTRFLKDPFED